MFVQIIFDPELPNVSHSLTDLLLSRAHNVNGFYSHFSYEFIYLCIYVCNNTYIDLFLYFVSIRGPNITILEPPSCASHGFDNPVV